MKNDENSQTRNDRTTMSVRATLLNILKWALCRLYKKFRVR